MRVLLTTNPGIGHLNPMLPIASALRQAGHQVAFASSASFCPVIEARGFQALEAGLDWLETEVEANFPESRGMSPEELSSWFMTDLFTDIAAHQMVPDLLEIGARWKPDLIVRNDYEFGSCVAAECLGIPQATVSICFFMSPSLLKPLVGDQLAYLRSVHGLAPYPALDMLYPYLYLSYAPISVQPPELPMIKSLRPTDMHTDEESLPDWVYDMPERPTIYASLGTVFNRVPDIFPAIVEGLRDEPINLIVTIGQNQDPEQFGPQPPHIHIVRYIPHTLLFPLCDLFITHSPFYTVMSALSYGLPLLMVPIAGDQPAHAARVAGLGVGRVLKRKAHPENYFGQSVPELSPESVRVAVRELLGDPSYKMNAGRIKNDIESLEGPESAVDLLVRLVESRYSAMRAG
ncbi:MAG TPA: glycosyltransferase [Chloroflexia bacterium]|nr:glycosyltransferase [Chloroflexia bacterium]